MSRQDNLLICALQQLKEATLKVWVQIDFGLIDNQYVVGSCASQMCQYLKPNLKAKSSPKDLAVDSSFFAEHGKAGRIGHIKFRLRYGHSIPSLCHKLLEGGELLLRSPVPDIAEHPMGTLRVPRLSNILVRKEKPLFF